jgi:hypothetical protein
MRVVQLNVVTGCTQLKWQMPGLSKGLYRDKPYYEREIVVGYFLFWGTWEEGCPAVRLLVLFTCGCFARERLSGFWCSSRVCVRARVVCGVCVCVCMCVCVCVCLCVCVCPSLQLPRVVSFPEVAKDQQVSHVRDFDILKL